MSHLAKIGFQVFSGLVLAALVWGEGFSQGAGSRPEPRILDEIVAKVNHEIITLTDLERTLRQFRTELEHDFSNPQELEQEYERRKSVVLRMMIQNKVLIQKAEELGVTSDVDVDVAAYIEELRRDAGIPSLEVLDQYFRQRGSSLQEYRQRVREQLITQTLLQQFVYSKITLLTPEVEAYYQEHQDRFRVPGNVHLAEILFLTEDRDREQARRQAEEALARLEGGEEFGEVARQTSEGPTASRGGDIGTFNQGSMNEALEAVTFEIPVGTHSGIVETDYGFQIVKVMDRTPPGLKPLQEVRPQIAEALYQRKAEPEVRSYLQSLVEESFIYVAPKYAERYDVAGLGI